MNFIHKYSCKDFPDIIPCEFACNTAIHYILRTKSICVINQFIDIFNTYETNDFSKRNTLITNLLRYNENNKDLPYLIKAIKIRYPDFDIDRIILLM